MVLPHRRSEDACAIGRLPQQALDVPSEFVVTEADPVQERVAVAGLALEGALA